MIGGVMKGAFMGGTLMNGISSTGAMMDAGKMLSKYGNDKFMSSSFKQAYDDFVNEPNIFDTTYKDVTYAGLICGPQLEQT